MATTTITITDLDLDAGTVATSVEVTDHALDDGFMTAAHVYAAFIARGMNDPDFLAQVWAFAKDLIADAPGNTIANDANQIEMPATAPAAERAA